MSAGRLTILTLTRIEVSHLRDLVSQFADLVTAPSPDDGAIARLTPSAYPDDPEAAEEFRGSTRAELLDRRADDAVAVLCDLDAVEEAPLEEAFATVDVAIEADSLESWLRTLAAVRLVLAIRLGIADEDHHDEDDPRFALYDWLGYRLDGLITAAE